MSMARSMYVMLCNSAATAELYCGFIVCLISSFVIVDRDIIEQSHNGCCCGRAAADGSTHVHSHMQHDDDDDKIFDYVHLYSK